MSPSLRSEGWTVRPSFVPNGPTTPVTLLFDDAGLTQLAGVPAVVWQTPWSELHNVQLLRFARGMALFATTGDVRYCWRSPQRHDYERLGEVVTAHGGQVVRQRRRGAVYAVVAVVALASVAGGIGAWFSSGSSGAKELAGAQAIDLTLRDLPSTFSPVAESDLEVLFPPSSDVVDTTTTTAPKLTSKWGEINHQFDTCMGVSYAKDRIYGGAGQYPIYQVNSKYFASTLDGGIQVVSTAQYYQSTTMVKKDTAEMSEKPFATCFVNSQALILKTYANASSASDTMTFTPKTFEPGWTRAGEATLSVPSVTGKLHLVVVELTSGHYEVTLGALEVSWPKTEPFISSLVSTLLSRMKSTTSVAD
jgi:hypothetical protein